jgi:hypothetical protein
MGDCCKKGNISLWNELLYDQNHFLIHVIALMFICDEMLEGITSK